ncbi:nuclear transport factor 2 family protein [Thalassospiraceae bacterium SW-3-3]|nr:nuclear transport factor 2 family protein [Thalassospiraceae bacterium SW-3-3]
MIRAKVMLFSTLVASLIAIGSALPAHAGEVEDRNSANVVAFYDMVFNQRDVNGAITKYIGDEYIQHNPFVADGIDGFRAGITGWLNSDPKIHAEIVRTVAEGNLVVTHVRSTSAEGESAVMDIFRLDDAGKIIEHWDVSQPVPAEQAHDNTMF